MGFIMQSCLRKNKSVVILLLFGVVSECLWANEFSAIVHNVKIESNKSWYKLNADIDFKLSPIAKEALQKGIVLSWTVLIKVEQEGFIWDSTLKKLETGFQMQNHILLNMYSVKKTNTETSFMFSTLAAAFNYISKIRDLAIIDVQSIHPDEKYNIAIKVQFNREALPIPLRPLSYFNPQWALSSQRTLWQLQN